MSDQFEPSEQFSDLFFLALDHGFNSMSDNEGPLIPFTLTVTGIEKPALTRHVSDDLAQALEFARQSIRNLRGKVSMYAIAWDGYVTIDGVKQDAILVEAGQVSDPMGVMFCQRYSALKKPFLRPARRERIGNPAMIGRAPSRLSPESDA